MQIIEALRGLPMEQQLAIAGIVAWLITQAVKYVFGLEKTAKVRKLATAAVMALFAALATEWAGVPELLVNFLGTLAAAISAHEITDKLGVQQALAMPEKW